jgi:tetratricopeptide (TPR) repeat protein
VFRGGFSLDAAAEVMRLSGAPGDAPSNARAIGAIQALYDKSLLRSYEPSGFPGELRYGLLEGVREYAAEKLAASGQAAAANDRHARHFLAAGAAWARLADGHGGLERRRRLGLDAENLLAVCERSLARAPVTAEDGRCALEALLALEPIMVQCARGRLEPYVDQLDAALAATAADGESGRVRARALSARATADLVRGRFELAFVGFHEALLLAREVGERAVEGLALLSLGLSLVQSDLPDEGRARFDEARVIVDELGDPRLEGHWLLVVGAALTWRGDAGEAAAHYEEATARFHGAGDAIREGMALGQLGLARMNLGRYEEARADCERALGLLRQIDERRAEGYVLGVLGRVLQALGRHDEARSSIEDALAVHRAVGDRWSEGFHVGLLGNLEFERRSLDGARRHYERAVSLFDELTSAPRAGGEPGSRSILRRYAGLYLVRLGAVLAASGQLEEAARRLEHAESVLAGLQKDIAAPAATLHQAHLVLALAARAADGGDGEGVARHLRAVRSAIAEVEQDDSGRSALCRSEEVRFTLRVLRREIDALEGAAPPRDAGAGGGAPDAFVSSLAPAGFGRAGLLPTSPALQAGDSAATFVVGPEARWFQRAGRERVHLLKNRAARLVLRRLVGHRLHAPGEALALAELFEAGWPGERISESAAQNRVYVTLTKLRKLGLYGLLQSRDDGFLLDPAANVVMEASTEGEGGGEGGARATAWMAN